MTDLAELRKLADAVEVTAATPWYRAGDLANDGRIQCAEDAAYIAAASPAVVLGLLDDLAAAEAEVARQNAGRDVERNMIWAAVPKLERLAEIEERLADVRELHKECSCGFGNAHCTTCESISYPCPTIRALDGRADS